jgi:hypothetical protein
MATGVGNSTCCQPDADSPVNVAEANAVPVPVQRVATWVPVFSGAL